MVVDGARHVVRIVVPAPGAATNGPVLARANGLAGWQLPAIAVPESPSWGPAHEAAARALLGGTVHPVRRLGDEAWEAEIADRLPAAGTAWIGVDEAARAGRDATLIRSWADTPYDAVPHLRPGWRRDVDEWAARHLAAAQPATLVRHWELAGIVRVPTPRGRVVVKEPGPGFEREARITDALAGLPGAPTVVYADDARFASAWAGAEHPHDRVALAERFGLLQRRAVDRRHALVDAGCRAVTDELPAHHDAALLEALEHVDTLELPESVVHGDAHLGNAMVDETTMTVIDWSDAALGCPAIDLDLLTGMGDEAVDVEPVVGAWARGFDCDPAPVVAALPHLRRLARARAVELLGRLAAIQPTVARPFWRREQAWYRHQLAALDETDG